MRPGRSLPPPTSVNKYELISSSPGTIQYAQGICRAANVTNLPTAATCASTSAAAATATSTGAANNLVVQGLGAMGAAAAVVGAVAIM